MAAANPNYVIDARNKFARDTLDRYSGPPKRPVNITIPSPWLEQYAKAFVALHNDGAPVRDFLLGARKRRCPNPECGESYGHGGPCRDDIPF